MVDIDELRERFLNLEFDSKSLRISEQDALVVAEACGESRPEYTDPSHPAFQASPAIVASLASGRHLPIDFPSLGGIGMDGGKAVQRFKPVPVEAELTGRTHLHDIYAKSGRSGRMVFIVARMEIYDGAGEQLALSDSRMVVREKPE